MAFHRDVSTKEILSPTLLGVNNMAMKFLPANLRLLTVISVTREIVAGVKYELLVNAMQEDGERIVCDLLILEKPWIVNQWGEKWRSLLHTNCTVDGVVQEPSTNDPASSSPADTYHVNPVFNQQSVALTADRMHELEQQILRGNQRRVANPILPEPTNDTPTPLEPMPTPSSTPSPATSIYPQLPATNEDALAASGVRDELDKFFQTQQQQQQLATQQQQVPVNEGGITTTVQQVNEQEPPLSSAPLTVSAAGRQPDDDLSRVQYSTSISAGEEEKEKQPESVPILPNPSNNRNNDNDNNDKDEQEDNGQQRLVPVFENNNNDNNNQQQATMMVTSATGMRRRRRRESLMHLQAGFVEIARMTRNLGDGGVVDDEDGGVGVVLQEVK